MFKCRVSGVRKKKMGEKYRERKIKVFLGENLKCGILLSSCSLVGLYVCKESSKIRYFCLLGSYPLVGCHVD